VELERAQNQLEEQNAALEACFTAVEEANSDWEEKLAAANARVEKVQLQLKAAEVGGRRSASACR
jgi:predicted  nucleic acid-binding Zn-ribbon protein